MKQNLLNGWNLQRIVLLILGTAVITQSAIEREWLGLIPGVYLAAMGILGFGCAAGSCHENYYHIDTHVKKANSSKAGEE